MPDVKRFSQLPCQAKGKRDFSPSIGKRFIFGEKNTLEPKQMDLVRNIREAAWYCISSIKKDRQDFKMQQVLKKGMKTCLVAVRRFHGK